MIRTCFVVAALVALSACATASATRAGQSEPVERPDGFGLQIEIGRYNVMLHHVEELTNEMPSTEEVAMDSPQGLARELRETVWKYNLTRSQLCARGLYTDITCAPAFAPPWLTEPPTAEPSLEVIQDRSGVVGTRVMQLWDRVCDDARQRAGKPEDRVEICGIE